MSAYSREHRGSGRPHPAGFPPGVQKARYLPWGVVLLHLVAPASRQHGSDAPAEKEGSKRRLPRRTNGSRQPVERLAWNKSSSVRRDGVGGDSSRGCGEGTQPVTVRIPNHSRSARHRRLRAGGNFRAFGLLHWHIEVTTAHSPAAYAQTDACGYLAKERIRTTI